MMKWLILLLVPFIMGADFVVNDVTFRELDEYTDYTQDANCMGVWRFNGTEFESLLDGSGNDNHLINSGADFKTSECQESECYDVEAGDSDYMKTTDDNALDLGTDDFTFMVWIKPETVSADMYILDKFSSLEAAGYQWFIRESSSDAQRFRLDDTDSNSTDDSNTSIVTGQWQHIAVAGDRDGNLTFYYNGSSDGAFDISSEASSASNSDDLNIFSDESDAQPLDGRGDEVAMFNRLLSAAEIKDIYTHGLR